MKNEDTDNDAGKQLIKINTCITEAVEEAIGKRKVKINSTNQTQPSFIKEIKIMCMLKTSKETGIRIGASQKYHVRNMRDIL